MIFNWTRMRLIVACAMKTKTYVSLRYVVQRHSNSFEL